jgi:hypothetical protein
VVFDKLNARFQPESRQGEGPRRLFRDGQKLSADAPALSVRRDRQFTDIEAIALRPQKDATDQRLAFERDMDDLSLRFPGKRGSRQVEGRGWRINPILHVSE